MKNILTKNNSILIFFLYSYSLIMALKLGFFFDGSSRYLSLRYTFFIFPFLLLFFFGAKFKINRNIIYCIIYIFIIFFYLFIWSINYNYENVYYIHSLINFLFPLLVVLNLCLFAKFLNKNIFLKAGKIYIIVTLLLVMLDTYVRIFYPEYAYKGDYKDFLLEQSRDSFYIYKYGSIMYLDSNYVALSILLIIGMNPFVFSGKVKYFIFIFCLVLLYFTFSRAAYFGLFLMFLFWIFTKFNFRSKTILLFLIVVYMMFFLVMYLSSNYKLDDSLFTKIVIFASLNKLYDFEFITVLFGCGFDYGDYLFSYKENGYAHALIPLLIGEIGVIGCLLYHSALIYVLYKKISYFLYIIPVMMFCGLSLIYPWDSMYFFVITYLIIISEIKK